jgi:very-short-patch-repair endonuclease
MAQHMVDLTKYSGMKGAQTLEDFGFHVVRVTNTDVYANIEGVLELIASTLPSTNF